MMEHVSFWEVCLFFFVVFALIYVNVVLTDKKDDLS